MIACDSPLFFLKCTYSPFQAVISPGGKNVIICALFDVLLLVPNPSNVEEFNRERMLPWWEECPNSRSLQCQVWSPMSLPNNLGLSDLDRSSSRTESCWMRQYSWYLREGGQLRLYSRDSRDCILEIHGLNSFRISFALMLFIVKSAAILVHIWPKQTRLQFKTFSWV